MSYLKKLREQLRRATELREQLAKLEAEPIPNILAINKIKTELFCIKLERNIF